MADWTYCGTYPPVNEQNTQALLRERQAIWCPPQHHQGPLGLPKADDRVWLLWRPENAGVPLIVLGGGIVLPLANPRPTTDVLHTERDEPGLRTAAEALGYGGPTNMAFLKVHCLMLCRQDISNQLGHLPAGPKICNATVTVFLQAVCPLP